MLEQNFPNPFNPKTTVVYDLPIANYVYLAVYDLLGRKIKTLIDEEQLPGYYRIEWDAGNLPSGVYFCKLEASYKLNNNDEQYIETKKMLLVK